MNLHKKGGSFTTAQIVVTILVLVFIAWALFFSNTIRETLMNSIRQIFGRLR